MSAQPKQQPTHHLFQGELIPLEKEVCCPRCEAEGNVGVLDVEQDPDMPFYYCYCYLCEHESQIEV